MLSRNRSIIGVLVLACLVGIGACGSSTAPPSPMHFQGNVTDAATGAPIAGARVELDASHRTPTGYNVVSSTLTDDAGHFALEDRVCDYFFFFSVSASGYDSLVTHSSICSLLERPLEFRLTKRVVR